MAGELKKGSAMRIWFLLLITAFLLYRVDSVLDLLKKLLSILSPFVVGTFMAMLVNIPMGFLESRLTIFNRTPLMRRIRRAICLTLSLLIVLSVIAVLLVVIIPEVIAALEDLISALPGLLARLETWLTEQNANLRQLFGLTEASEGQIREQFQNAYQFLIGGIGYSSTVVLSAAQLVINALVGIVFSIYLLYSKERIKRQIFAVAETYLKPAHSAAFCRGVDLLTVTFSRFIGGQCLQALLSSVLTWLAMILFGMPFALLISLIVFVMAFIPIFGPYISGVIGTLLIVSVDPSKALWFVVIFLIVQQLEGSIIYPSIMSSAIDMPSIWVLVAVTLGGGVMGIAGMLLFIPLAAVLYNVVEDDVRRKREQQHPAPAVES